MTVKAYKVVDGTPIRQTHCQVAEIENIGALHFAFFEGVDSALCLPDANHGRDTGTWILPFIY